MTYQSINPFSGETLKTFDSWTDAQLEAALAQVAAATPAWADTELNDRCQLLRRLGETIREQREKLAEIMTLEMGKRIIEARAEIDKCVGLCDYYAEHAPEILADEIIESDAGKSLVAYQPLGTVLAVMPWNFPFWQVLRFAVPAFAAGNTGVLKHASNVPQCALAIEQVIRDAGFPEGVFRTLMIDAKDVAKVIADPRIHAVTLTGSEAAGRKVAACAGEHLKKTVLELGGSDPFVVLEDADLDLAVVQAVASRFLNAGQTCIAAKRFIVVDRIADEFVARYTVAINELQPGDPMDENTTLAPMARDDLREEVHRQVQASIKAGAVLKTGGALVEGEGNFYQPTLLDNVIDGMSAFNEELFGPVASVIRVHDEQHALAVANDTRFGLGSSVWTRNNERGEAFARKLQAGCAFVNGIVKSDPRLPFGGVKASGYGRELSHHGLLEFVNAKTIWIR